ncbi:MAG: L-aspartate oxidase [Cyanobacteria bacterium MAG IRC1_bin_28]|nr:L-aspartate oxidase [Cyanobacteria bacterium MAG IRC1_bin_28]
MKPDCHVFDQVWDVVVVGSGAAGLMACLALPDELNILLLTKDSRARSASRWAQGGIAAALGPDDSTEAHFHDTLAAGAGLCEPLAVRLLVEQAPRCVERLLSLGVRFDRQGGQLSRTIEAAHSQRRVLHAADQTGRAIMDVLQARVRERPRLHQHNDAVVLQLWRDGRRCCGLQLMAAGVIGWLRAGVVVLASGGGCRLFAQTTNPPLASGDGVVMAYRAGAVLRDLEFVQFHPTALMVPGAPHFLISEAARGEGAVLHSLDGSDPVAAVGGGNLASRDEVSRAVARHMVRRGDTHVWLDLRPIGQERLLRQFPSILDRCRAWGIDPLTMPVPVAPAAHYWMGGVETDLQARTTVPGLYALGEVASSGVHGANRLASNSLMECLVCAHQLGQGSLDLDPGSQAAPACRPGAPITVTSRSMVTAQEMGRRIRHLCWTMAGVNRQEDAMAMAQQQLQALAHGLDQRPELVWLKTSVPGDRRPILPQTMGLLRRWVEVEHLCALGLLLLEAARFRRESRGGHHRLDHPAQQPFWRCHSRQQQGRAITSSPVGLED